MPVMQCARCGRPNPEDARYCSHCGTPLLAGLVGPDSRQPGAGPPRVANVPRPGETTSTISLNRDDADYGDDLYPDSDSLASLPAGTALLLVKRGPNAGASFRLDNDLTTAGRHPDSDIFLDDVTVSRRHVEFYRENGRFTVRDVGSLNGTYVNGSRIEEAELTGGDEVQIGKFRLQFLTSPDLWGQTIPGERHGRGSQGYA
ncbi:MAG TPA: FHA domain-containing protein [Streptosporangiaceae bacterium]|nr:FHA domain-containing protein [Streptosporangiaceae bacterium]